MPYCTANGLRIYYRQRGPASGPPLVLIPGLGGSHAAWNAVLPHLSRFRTLAVDPRDAGRSDRFSADYAIADMAGDIASVIQQRIGAPATIVGFSMGGAIAQELALRHPALVRRLILIATYDAGDPRGDWIFQQFGALRRTLPRAQYHRVLLPWLYTHQEFARAIDPEALVRQLAADPRPQSQDAYERQALATVRFHSRSRLGGIACPSLLIFGDDDLFTPLRFARSLRDGIPRARLKVLRGTGHGLLLTRAQEIGAAIDGFAGPRRGRQEPREG